LAVAANRKKEGKSAMDPDLRLITVFVTVAQTRSFRAAAAQLGVTHSAVSQGLRRLEDELGVALMQRTTRSVRLTEAGERLLQAMRPALGDVTEALEAIAELRARPSGLLRLCVSSIAESFLHASTLTGFLDS
jgi:DNA-binding transcriptional LysR family regulator